MTDPADIDYWNAVENPRAAAWSDPDWNQGIEDCLDQIIPWLPVRGRILDVGAGVGRLAIPIAERLPDVNVLAFEPSTRMFWDAPAAARVHWYTRWPEETVDAALIVTVLQHLPHDRQAELIAKTADRLTGGGTLIFQTVAGDADGPGSHHTNFRQVGEWCDQAGLKIIKSHLGAVRPGWLWTVAQ